MFSGVCTAQENSISQKRLVYYIIKAISYILPALQLSVNALKVKYHFAKYYTCSIKLVVIMNALKQTLLRINSLLHNQWSLNLQIVK